MHARRADTHKHTHTHTHVHISEYIDHLLTPYITVEDKLFPSSDIVSLYHATFVTAEWKWQPLVTYDNEDMDFTFDYRII